MTNAYYARTRVFRGLDIYGKHVAPAWGGAADNPDQPADFRVGFGASLQDAIDQAIARNTGKRCVIDIGAGFFEGPVVIPSCAPSLTLRGAGAAQTVLAAPIDAKMSGLEYRSRFGPKISTYAAHAQEHFAKVFARQTIGTHNTAVLTVARDDVEISGLTIRNDYQCDRDSAAPDGAQPDAEGRFADGQHQAVALMIDRADRVRIESCMLSSFQDTLYLRADPRKPSRIAIDRCTIEGDVDFIFGGATAHFLQCEIRSRGLRGAQSWVAAPSTSLHMPYGFVFENCAFSHDGAETGGNGRSFLGRQWFEGVRATPYGTPTVAHYASSLSDANTYDAPHGTISRRTLEAVGKCAVLNAKLGKHLNPQQLWDAWGGPNWSARFRPVQHGPSDFLHQLGPWLKAQSLDYEHIHEGPEWLVEV